MTTVHRHPLAGNRRLGETSDRGSLEAAPRTHLTISWRCLGELPGATSTAGTSRTERFADTHVRLDLHIEPDRDASVDPEHDVPGEFHSVRSGWAQLSLTASGANAKGDLRRLPLGAEHPIRQRVRLERAGRWFVIELEPDGVNAAIRLVAIVDLGAAIASSLSGAGDADASAALTYISTDLFARLGIGGGRYDRPEGRLSRLA